MTNTVFTDRLNQMVKKRKMTITTLAEKSGLNKGTINAYLKGRYNAKPTNVKKLADALNVDDLWLMGLDDETAWEIATKRVERSINDFNKGMQLCGFTPDEAEAFSEYKCLTEDRKKLIQRTIHLMLESQPEE